MAPSQMETTAQDYGYTHKKFNSCGYAHKKFGNRLDKHKTQYNMDYSETTTTIINESTKIDSSKKDIFRPYALADNATRKRKFIELALDDNRALEQKRPTWNFIEPLDEVLHLASLQSNTRKQQQNVYNASQQSLAILMQKQRAAFYLEQQLIQNSFRNIYNLNCKIPRCGTNELYL